MRFLPLLSSQADPELWRAFPAVELRWEGHLHPGWPTGPEVHALHLDVAAGDEALLGAGRDALRGLAPDFLVVPGRVSMDRQATARFLGGLESLLELLAGRGVKVALRPAPGEAAALASLLKEVRCDAVGYCWHKGVGEDLEAISDRLFCAVGGPDGHYPALQRLGYRWNMAIPAADPSSLARVLARLEAAHPMIYFPQVAP